MTTYAYCRVSTTEQAEGTSLEDQERRVRGVAMMRGEEIAEVFGDVGVPGFSPLASRPNGARLLEALQPGDVVIAAKMDRLFRSALEALATAQDFQRRGVSLILADMGTDPVTENGAAKMFFTMMAAVAEFERTRIAERMADGRKGKAERGGHIGGSAPFGWRVEGKGRAASLVPVPEEQTVLTRARQLQEGGASLTTIAKVLTGDGTRRTFNRMQVYRMLRRDTVPTP